MERKTISKTTLLPTTWSDHTFGVPVLDHTSELQIRTHFQLFRSAYHESTLPQPTFYKLSLSCPRLVAKEPLEEIAEGTAEKEVARVLEEAGT